MCRCGGTKMKLCTCDHIRDEVLVTGCVQQCDDLGRHLKARLSYIHRNATTPANNTTQYLQLHCEPTSTVTSRRLRSAHSGRLTVPRTRTNYGDQGPRVWNSLPAELRTPDITLAMFRNRLKTFLFYL